MLPDLALRTPAALSLRLPRAWHRPLLHLALAFAINLLLFAHVWADMVLQYWDASTYNHILFVPLILGWLVRLRAPELAKLTPTGFWPALVPLAGGLFVWLLGDISGLALATHLGVVVTLQMSVLAFLGPRVAAALLFPLAYMLFLVPFGDELVPALQMITADLTIALTHASGIPATIDGVFIDTPAGLFEVAEACSGVKFLIAMIALGTLAAHVCFTSWRRRILFMTVAIALPILANGVRAWGTIFIAQSQGVEFAQGFDHIFYGWVFFALVMALLLALSWRFFDRAADDRFIDAQAIEASPMLGALQRLTITPPRALLLITVMSLGAIAWSAQARQVAAPLPQQIALPEVAGWTRAPLEPQLWWEPRAAGADHRLLGSYRNAAGAQVEVFFALYASQEEGSEAGAFGEGALMPDTGWRWQSPGPDFGSGMSDRLQAGGGIQRLALTHYRHRDLLGGSVAWLKLSNIRDRLTLSPAPTAMLILSAGEGQGVPAEQAMRDFLAATQPLGEWMDQIAQKP
ncbi:hypothetical protein GCM10009127_21390 [Alteraurantiacibacter aestuarii]|uniref:exosortase A n=1 Tax=Alteraurantiacibacter aestuarii TaxID=650004 RepID=UPI0031DCA2E8